MLKKFLCLVLGHRPAMHIKLLSPTASSVDKFMHALEDVNRPRRSCLRCCKELPR